MNRDSSKIDFVISILILLLYLFDKLFPSHDLFHFDDHENSMIIYISTILILNWYFWE